MPTDVFPNPSEHHFPEWAVFDDFYYHASDIICFGVELNVGNLREAYSKGIFPWYIEGMPLPWFCPAKRAILDFEHLHVPKSLKKEIRKTSYSFTIDEAFEDVIKSCAETVRNFETGTWITEDFICVYTEFYDAGHAHSVEVWDEDNNLVGGLYGVDAGGVFCGESMFFEKPNASKLALVHLIDHLRSGGSTWLDIQVMTPHMEALGAEEIPREIFLEKLNLAQNSGLSLFD